MKKVLVIGNDFEVEICAYKNLIKRIEELNQNKGAIITKPRKAVVKNEI